VKRLGLRPLLVALALVPVDLVSDASKRPLLTVVHKRAA